MNRWTFNLLIVLILFANLTTLAPADELSKYENRLASKSSGTRGFLEVKIRLTHALQDRSLKRALENASEAVELAIELGDPELILVSRLDMLATQALLTGDRSDFEALRGLGFIVSEPESIRQLISSPELRVHAGCSLLKLESWIGNANVNYLPTLQLIEEAANRSNSEEVLACQLSTDAFVRVFCLGRGNSNSAKLLLERLEKESESLSIEQQVVVQLLKSSEDVARSMEYLESALALAEKAENSFWQWQCYSLIGIQAYADKDFATVEEVYKHAHRFAQELSCPSLKASCLTMLATVQRKQRLTTSAAETISRANKSNGFSGVTLGQRRRISRLGKRIQEDAGKNVDGSGYQNGPLTEEAAREIDSNHREIRLLARNARKATEKLMAEKQEVIEVQEQFATKTKARIDFLKRYSLIATMLAFLIGLLFFIVLVGRRLERVNHQLALEKEAMKVQQSKFQRLEDRLNRIQRMESLGLMAGGVAHDFNNILVGVIGNAELAQMKISDSDPEFLEERLKNIINSAEKAASLSRKMLAYSGNSPVQRKPANINKVVSEYEHVLHSVCSSGQSLDIDQPEQPVIVDIDQTQFEQVLLNLVSNSSEASSKDGSIKIKVRTESLDAIPADISFFGTRKTGGDFCVIEVSDEGVGIDSAEIERIFDPFYSTADLGRGLGLAVVYGVTETHEGVVRCKSSPGKGTSISLFLPISDSTMELASLGELKKSVTQSVANRSLKHILVIDDEESVVDLCSELLRMDGWSVLRARGGEMGLELIEQYIDELACVLLDVVMPEMGANDVLRVLEENSIDIPVVIMSGFSQTKLEFFEAKPNVIGMLQKPFRASDLRLVIESADSRNPKSA